MKKILSLLISLLLCVSVFSGCERHDTSVCEHNWKLVSQSDYEYKCSDCNETHLCVNPEDLERAGNLNESTAIYKCRICGSEQLTTDPDSLLGNRLTIAMTIAETRPSCVVFEYKDEKPYCFYAYDVEGKLYRVLWNDFTGLSENSVIDVEFENDFKTLRYDEYPDSGWTPQYEITATNVYTYADNHEDHNWQIVSQDNGCWYSIVTYACSKCDMEQTAEADLALPNHSWTEETTDGKTTFACTRCNESYTCISEIREFSYAQALEEYKIGNPGVKHENFNNPAIEFEITGAIDAIIRAEFELTIEYDTISVSYDETSNMWRVGFWTLDLDGNSQSVYVNGNGLTCYIVYGE